MIDDALLERLARASSLRVGLISDTHIPEAMPALWPQAYAALEGVDCILHAGDIHDLSVIDELSEIAPTFVARGNGDDGGAGRPVQPDDSRLREAWLLDLGGVRVGMTHTLPVPDYGGVWTLHAACERHFGSISEVDVLVCGDTHTEWVERIHGVLCVNPGSPTLPRNLRTSLGTFGFLQIANGRASAHIRQLTEDGHAPLDWASWRRPL